MQNYRNFITSINVIFLFSIVTYSQIVVAKMYKWVDEDGNTHYTQSVPPDGIDGIIIKPPGSVDEEAALELLEKQKQKADALLENRIKKLEKKEKERAEIERITKNCEIAKTNMASLAQPRLNLKDEAGEIYIVPEEERLQRLNKAKEDVNKYCN